VAPPPSVETAFKALNAGVGKQSRTTSISDQIGRDFKGVIPFPFMCAVVVKYTIHYSCNEGRHARQVITYQQQMAIPDQSDLPGSGHCRAT
jgi:hypothetical protein